MNKQYQIDKFMLDTANLLKEQSKCIRGKVGCIITKDDRIIVTGYNGTIAGTDNTCEYHYLLCNKCKSKHVVSNITDNNVYTFTCEKCNAVNNYSNLNYGPKPIDKPIDPFITYTELKTNEFTMHAEQNAISYAAKKGIPLEDTTLYCTMLPCKTCAKLIASVGITKVIYSSIYRDTSSIEFFDNLNIEHYQFKG